MTLLRNAFSSVFKAPEGTRPPMTTALSSWLYGEGASSTNRIALMQAYSQVSWLFAVVSRITQAVASVEWKLFFATGTGDPVEVKRHPLLDLWLDANPFDTQQEFLETSQQYLDLTGESWWLVVKDNNGLPRELWSLRPDRMRPIPHRTEYISGYVYTIGAERVPLTREDIIFLRMPSPLDPYRGAGPVGSLLVDIGAEHEAAQWTRNFFRNSAEPGGIIEVDENISDSEFESLRQRWAEQHQGVGSAHRVALLEKGHWVERKYTQRDMQFDQLRRLNRDLILGAFGMPLPLLGIVESVNRANAEAAEIMFFRWVVRPRLERIKAALNTRLCPMFGEGLRFEYVDPTPENRDLDLAEAERGYRAGILRLNEARALLNLEPVEEGEEFYVAPGPTVFGLNDGQGGPPKGIATLVQKLPTPLDSAEGAMRRAWSSRLHNEAVALGEYLAQFMSRSHAPAIKIELADLAAYDWDWWAKYHDGLIAELARAFTATVMQEFPGIPPSEANRLASEYAETRGARLLRLDGDLNMVNFTRERVNQLVSQSIAQGDSLQALQQALRDDLAFSKERARMVARTETATAQGEGARGAALSQGRDEKSWITQGDDAVDSDLCLANEMQGWIGIGDPFQSGHDQIPAHPNCRCVTIYRTAELHSLSTEHRRCPQCGKATLLLNKDGPGFYCRRCKMVIRDDGAIVQPPLEQPKIRRVQRTVERDEAGRIRFVIEEEAIK